MEIFPRRILSNPCITQFDSFSISTTTVKHIRDNGYDQLSVVVDVFFVAHPHPSVAIDPRVVIEPRRVMVDSCCGPFLGIIYPCCDRLPIVFDPLF